MRGARGGRTSREDGTMDRTTRARIAALIALAIIVFLLAV
jgi:hypothetical protein